MSESLFSQVESVIKQCTAIGANAADVLAIDSTDVSVSVRKGETEGVERSESKALGIRVFVGKRQAITSSADLSKEALDEAVERAVAMARCAPEDVHAGLPETVTQPGDVSALQLCDATEPEAEWLLQFATDMEAAALANEAVTNSEGADAGYTKTRFALANSEGFSGTYQSSRFSAGLSVLAEQDGAKERDYEFASRRFVADLPSAESIGVKAAERTVRRLGGCKVPSQQVPIVFDPRVGRSLLRYLASAISGNAVARGTSFLKNDLGQRIFPKAITIMDDPYIERGLASRPFDGEGLSGGPRAMVENGQLKSWFLDTHSARQLGMESTGHASRGLSASPSPSSTNLFICAGDKSPEELMADIKQGFFVTEVFGMGVNTTTGDYSQGASGLWIENGKLAEPVHEITIAGHLRDMFAGLKAANDLEFESRHNVPTLRVAPMTVAGS